MIGAAEPRRMRGRSIHSSTLNPGLTTIISSGALEDLDSSSLEIDVTVKGIDPVHSFDSIANLET